MLHFTDSVFFLEVIFRSAYISNKRYLYLLKVKLIIQGKNATGSLLRSTSLLTCLIFQLMVQIVLFHIMD